MGKLFDHSSALVAVEKELDVLPPRKLFVLFALAIITLAPAACRSNANVSPAPAKAPESVLAVPSSTFLPAFTPTPTVAPTLSLTATIIKQAPSPDGNLRCVIISEVSIELCFPDGYLLFKNTEVNRRGSFVSYDFQPLDGYQTPYLKELQFFSEASITEFINRCDANTPCFFDDYPDLERYHGQREALKTLTGFQDFELQSLSGRPFLTVNRPCYGDDCVIREYTTFLSDVKLDVWVVMVDESEVEQSDQLLTRLIIQDSPW
jgi:hypothetical protein